ncbi:MAG TPA: PAS domain S-box protein, partial [Acidimicrobiales bacterium]
MTLRHDERDHIAPTFSIPDDLLERLSNEDDLVTQLELERARLTATLDSLMDPHVIFTAVRDESGTVVDFVFTDANDAAIEYNRSTREKMVGARLSDILPGHKRAGIFDTYVRALESGEPLIVDDSVYFNEAWGSLRHCDVRALKVGDSLSYTWRDVTDRFHMLERFRLLAENASDIVFEADLDGLIRWISPSCRMLGWEPEDLLGHPIFDFVYPGDHEVVIEHRRDVLDGVDAASIEARYMAQHGEPHWMSVSAKATRDHDGAITAVVVGLRSIEGEVATRKSLARSEAHFRLLAENSSDVVVESDPNGVITWVSPSVYEMLGWRPEALIGTRAADLAADEDAERFDDQHQSLLAGGSVGRGQVQLRTASGHLHWMAVRAQPTRNASRKLTGSVISLRDCQSEVAAQRAARTLSAGSQVLIHSEREEDLLVAMCQAAADEGGYSLAWYGRKVHDAECSIEKVAVSKGYENYVDAIRVDWSTGRHGRGPAGEAIRSGEPFVLNSMADTPAFEPWVAQAAMNGFYSCVALPVYVEGEVDGCLQVYSGEPNAFEGPVVEVLKNLAEEMGFGIKRLRDHQRLLASLKDQALLTKAIDQASESILITDPSGAILYANPS